jgi:glycine/D-amino acid oxidase-like deaminating enzyme
MSNHLLTDDFKETPFWWDAAPRPPVDDSRPPAEADVVVVGSGNVGLSAALTLARAGRHVVVLDAEALGHGGSSRNAGYIGRTLWFKYGALKEKLGAEAAKTLTEAGGRAHDFVADLIEREQIACHFIDNGRFIPASSPAAYRKLEKDLEAMMRDGVGVDSWMLPRERQREELGSDLYHGGQVLCGTGQLHPGLYHQGLLERVVSQGVTAIGFCPATDIVRDGDRVTVTTPKGTISARDVIVATNGYTPKATSWLRRRVIPVPAYMIATEPLLPETMKAFFPNFRTMIDMRRNPYWARPSHDGDRVLFGGQTGMPKASLKDKALDMHACLTQIFPELAETKVSHCWTGNVAFTFDMLPHTGSHEGIHYAMGFCAAGVPMGTYMGHKTALRIIGDPDAATPFDDIRFPTKPFYTGHPWFLPLIVGYFNFMDRRV